MLRANVYRTAAFAVLLAAAGDASALTVTGQLRYADIDANGMPIEPPIRRNEVEVWRAHAGGDFSLIGATTTDESGRFTVNVRFDAGGTYELRVFARNPAVDVGGSLRGRFFARVGEPGPALRIQPTSDSSTLDYSFTFRGPTAAAHFNIADVILRGFDYVNANRDPLETDPLSRVNAIPFAALTTHYSPGVHTIYLEADFVTDDLTILHEYGHHVENAISSFLPLASHHDGCEINWGTMQRADLAWMEGFANYLAQAIAAVQPASLLAPAIPRGTPTAFALEAPPPCDMEADTVEDFVAAVLWDLHDDSTEEPWDRLSGYDDVILKIADRELDRLPFLVYPSLLHFAEAWWQRGLSIPDLNKILDPFGMSRIAPLAEDGYDADGLADPAVWHPDSGKWTIMRSSDGRIVTTQLGKPGMLAAPADYDGDGDPIQLFTIPRAEHS